MNNKWMSKLFTITTPMMIVCIVLVLSASALAQSGAGAGQGRPEPWFRAKDMATAVERVHELMSHAQR